MFEIHDLAWETKPYFIFRGHSPHDEAPEVVNSALIDWLKSIGYKA